MWLRHKEDRMAKQPESKLDSVAHHEERKALMQKEYELNQQKDQELARQHAAHRDDQEIANYGGIIKDGETRDQLLERIRNVSKVVPVEIQPLGRTPAMQKELEAEQQAGREAVARAEAEEKRNAELRQKMAADEAEREKKGADDSGTSSKSRHG
jgi:hypothetical protein